MTEITAIITCRSLREICLPGTYDAGMSEKNYGDHTLFGISGRTITQHLSVGDQLAYRIRYIDLRPTMSKGQLYTRHFEHVSVLGWEGANGQSIDSIIADVNGFTANHNELIILSISHTHNLDGQQCFHRPGTFPPGKPPPKGKRDACTDGGGTLEPTWADTVTDFGQDQWNALIAALKGLNYRWDVPSQYQSDVSKAMIGEMIDGKAAVIIMCHIGDSISLGDAENHGFVTDSHLSIYDSYADTDGYTSMMTDQWQKLTQQRHKADDLMFIFNYILTQSTWDTILDKPTVLEMGDHIFLNLFDPQSSWWPSLTNDSYPNIILADAVASDTRFVNMVANINAKFRHYGC
jgi:hypothetical protein